MMFTQNQSTSLTVYSTTDICSPIPISRQIQQQSTLTTVSSTRQQPNPTSRAIVHTSQFNQIRLQKLQHAVADDGSSLAQDGEHSPTDTSDNEENKS